MESEERPMKMRKLSSSGLEVGSMLKSKDEAAASHLSQPTNVTLESEQKNGAIPNGFSGQHNPSPTAASIALDPSAPLLYAKPALQLGENAEVVGSRNSESANADATETNIPDALDDESHASESSEDGGAQLPTASPMSKNQMKKLRKKEEWDAGREYRKKKRKQKIAEKRLRKRAAKEEAMKAKAEAPKDDDAQGKSETPGRLRHVVLPITFVLDCGFDDLMTEKERISLGAQLTRSYSDNHKAPFQAQLIVSSWGGELKQRFDTVLLKHHENWTGVEFMEGDFVEAAERAKVLMKENKKSKLAGVFTAEGEEKFSNVASAGSMPVAEVDENGKRANVQSDPIPEDTAGSIYDKTTLGLEEPFNNDLTGEGEVVYLTSDSPHTLDRLKPHSTYIIGGLVDKNRHKGICYKTACDRGVRTAKLPIGEYMEMQSRFVLATNHVVEIMVRWLECGDWGESFMKVMPKRKGGKLKEVWGVEGDGNAQDVSGQASPELSGNSTPMMVVQPQPENN